ncbi:hypothetical protein MC885_013321 [Smutsia gigantea]|nr:hypothetical protein MC885_013321 [Smutsia gigantea]
MASRLCWRELAEPFLRPIRQTSPTLQQFILNNLLYLEKGIFLWIYKIWLKSFTRLQRWSEGTTQKKKPNCVKEPERTSVVSHEPKRSTTQFPSVHAELLSEPEAAAEAARGPKPAPPRTPIPSSPPPPALSPEFAQVPADPAQCAVQMLGKVASTHSDPSDILMVGVATSMPVSSEEALSSEAEDYAVAAPTVCSGEAPKDREGEPPTASPVPTQDEQEPPAYDQAPEAPVQAGTEVTSVAHVSSICNDEPVTEGLVYVEQIPGQIVIPFTDHVACLKEYKQSPPVSPSLVVGKTASGVSEKSVGAAKLAQSEDTKHDSSVDVEVKDSTTTVCWGTSPRLAVPGSPGQEPWEHAASRAPEGKPGLPGDAAEAGRPAAPVGSSSGPPLPAPEMEPEWETAPEPGLMESGKQDSQHPNMWTLYCLTDTSQQSPHHRHLHLGLSPKQPSVCLVLRSPLPAAPTQSHFSSLRDDGRQQEGQCPPPFILVGSNAQEAPDRNPLPGYAVVSQSDALKRYTAVRVPTAVPADQKFQKHTPNPQNGSPSPIGEVAKKGSGSGDKHMPFGSCSIAGEINLTTAHVRKAEPQNW